jgi:ABC-type Zn uptake system ZnuABC Zn-binding protein ZnuA
VKNEPGRDAGKPVVLAVETFLADIVRQVAGDRLAVRALLPLRADPHSYEPTPRDVAAISGADLIISNGGGLESFLQKLLDNASGGPKGGRPRLVEASSGLTSRTAREGEAVVSGSVPSAAKAGTEIDPHFWLDPLLVIRYVENIREALKALDPADGAAFDSQAAGYMEKLRELDGWISREVSRIPKDRRLLVTNHESLGYFADRYGFRVIGTIIPSVGMEASPSAKQLALLISRLREAGPSAIFVETGTNLQLARQVAADAGVKEILELYDHSLTPADGPAPTYIDMMRFDVKTIVDALAGAPGG